MMLEPIVAGLLFAAVVFLFFHDLDAAPATWHDEGAALTLAQTWASDRVYGIRTSTGYQSFGAVQSVGPTVILPAALLLRRKRPANPEGRLRTARLVAAVYGALTSLAFYLVARQLFGWPTAAVSVFFLFSAGSANFLRFGRMFLGEIPALGFFLFGWLALTMAVRSGSIGAFVVAGVFLGCAMLTKSTYLVGFAGAAIGTAGFAWLTARPLPWAGLLLAAGVAFTGNAAWRVWLYGHLGPDVFRENARKMRRLAGTFAGFAPQRNLKNLLLVLHPKSGSFFHLVGIVAWIHGLRLAQASATQDWFGLTFLLFFVAAYLLYLAVSLPLMFYVMPPASVTALFVARSWLELGGRDWFAVALAGLLLMLCVRDLSKILKASVFDRDANAFDVARFLERETPEGSVVETWERELGFLAERSFHYPDESWLVQAHTLRYGGGGRGAGRLGETYFRQAPPDYLVIGPSAHWHGVYDLSYVANHSTPVATFGSTDARYEIHRWQAASERAARPIWVLSEPEVSPDPAPYLAEMLAAEGLNHAVCLPIAAVDRVEAIEPQVILLAAVPVSETRQQWLERFVKKGGLLVVFRPRPELRSLCGLGPADGTVDRGGMRIRVDLPELRGFSPATLRLDTPVDLGELADATPLAELTRPEGGEALGPVVARRSLGTGCVISWAYDLPANIARLRQGDPARVRPGFQRAAELFVRPGDDLELPDADEQQRFLVHLLVDFLERSGRPLPRLWYFPGQAESVLVTTGDAHGAALTAVEAVLSKVEASGGRFSMYYAFGSLSRPFLKLVRSLAYSALDYLPFFFPGRWARRFLRGPSPGDFERWRRRGHEMGLHPYLTDGIESGFADALADHVERGYAAVSASMRAHCVQWFGWVKSARAQAGIGVRMNLDYYHWGPPYRTPAGGWVAGFLTGSGLPMRFVDERGEVLSIFQQLTNLVDEHVLDLGWQEAGAFLDSEQALQFLDELFRRCVRWNAVVAGQFHVDPFASAGGPSARAAAFLDAALAAALRLGLPILSAEQWCEFNERRRSVRFDGLRWSGDEEHTCLEFRVSVPEAHAAPSTILLPESQARRLLSVRIDGELVGCVRRSFRGQAYACLPAAAGTRLVVAHFTCERTWTS